MEDPSPKKPTVLLKGDDIQKNWVGLVKDVRMDKMRYQMSATTS